MDLLRHLKPHRQESCRVLAAAFLMVLAPVAAFGQLDLSTAQIFSQYRPDSRFDLASQPEINDQIGSALASGDFDNDGYEDLVIGCASEDLGQTGAPGTLDDSGWVSVIYGGPLGVKASSGFEDLWDQEGDVEGGEEPGDRVGFSVAVGDFNGDQYDDLVMGSPFEAIGSVSSAGSVNVLYGSAGGLQTVGNRQWWQGRQFGGHGVAGTSEADDRFGWSLAVGDFNNDTYDDLAVGVPFESVGSVAGAGGVAILYGKPVIGLDSESSVAINRSSPGMLAGPGTGDHFGYALASGDFNGDGYDDLAIGVPHDDICICADDEGSVDVVFGSASGLDTSTNQLWDDQSASGWEMGTALAAGNFDGDGYDDLAIGVPKASSIGGAAEAGQVQVLYGNAADGLRRREDPTIGITPLQQGVNGLAGSGQAGDHFGQSLATGDVDGDGADELLVGLPGETVLVGGSAKPGAGAAQLILGSLVRGLTYPYSGNQILDYSVVGVPATTDGFGNRLTFGDFENDGRDDLAVAIPRRNVQDANGGNVADAGEIVVIYATTRIFADGFESGDTTMWSAGSP